jgi:phosphatidylserine/phosphatidylglycerophosphate/cardiolipin synthase-like enzyme
MLEESPATKRVLIWGHPIASLLNVDEPLVRHGEIPRDNFEYMTQENPTRGSFFWSLPAADFGAALAGRIDVTGSLLDDLPLTALGPSFTVDLTDFPFGFDAPLASYHQKLWIFDGDEAVVSGMNVKLTDWDDSEHEIFDHRRMEFDASRSQRQDVRDRERDADSGPRKDYAIYIQGPLVTDVEDLFASRWNLLIDEDAEYSWNASEIRPRALPELSGGVEAQLVTSMPEPYAEYSILDSHLNAVANATDYIFIEDQYWRAPILVDAIIERMEEVRGLMLIIVTKPVSEFTDPGCYWTHATDEALRDAFGDRYRTYQLQTFSTAPGFGFDETDGVFVAMDIHSKLMIIDDVFLSVGSCNKNNRGYVYEGEANVNVLDERWVTTERQEIIGNILGVAFTPSDWVAELERSAARNDTVYEAWDDEGFDLDLDGDPLPFAYDPRGFAYSLEFADPSDCLIEPIGPDIASAEDDDHP